MGKARVAPGTLGESDLCYACHWTASSDIYKHGQAAGERREKELERAGFIAGDTGWYRKCEVCAQSVAVVLDTHNLDYAAGWRRKPKDALPSLSACAPLHVTATASAAQSEYWLCAACGLGCQEIGGKTSCCQHPVVHAYSWQQIRARRERQWDERIATLNAASKRKAAST